MAATSVLRSAATAAAAAAWTEGGAGADRMAKLVALCKRRGFVFPSAELYNGLRGCYDYGPLGTLLKRNLAAAWWHAMVDTRPDVHALDTTVLTHRAVLETSGHVAGFTDPLVDCRLSKARFRADKAGPAQITADGRLVVRSPDRPTADAWCRDIASTLAPGARVERRGPNVVLQTVSPPLGTEAASLWLAPAAPGAPPVAVTYRGYVNPANNSPFLTPERQFNLMFSTHLGAVDPWDEAVAALRPAPPGDDEEESAPGAAADRVRQRLAASRVYLRPETAQGAFVQFANVVAATGAKLPFGLAQTGKAFRNEITLEHFLFRTAEFEQMELEYFCPPEDAAAWHTYWLQARLAWWRALLPRSATALRLVEHPRAQLAHYAQACTDIEFAYPWGWGELEGVAHRGDHDLRVHGDASGRTLAALLPDGRTRVVPHVIEPAAGLSRGVLAVLVDAYDERLIDPSLDSSDGGASGGGDPGVGGVRVVLRLHPALAPIKVAVCPLVKHAGMAAAAEAIGADLRRHALSHRLELSTSLSIGRRYARHDEIGTPWCVTVDHQTLEDGTVTVRDRDTAAQRRVRATDVAALVRDGCALATALPLPPLGPTA
jgi:glycyl-tRNA synthetase